MVFSPRGAFLRRETGVTGNAPVMLLHHLNIKSRQLIPQLLLHRGNQLVRRRLGHIRAQRVAAILPEVCELPGIKAPAAGMSSTAGLCSRKTALFPRLPPSRPPAPVEQLKNCLISRLQLIRKLKFADCLIVLLQIVIGIPHPVVPDGVLLSLLRNAQQLLQRFAVAVQIVQCPAKLANEHIISVRFGNVQNDFYDFGKFIFFMPPRQLLQQIFFHYVCTSLSIYPLFPSKGRS
ncbi:hypothetical protein D3C73_900370 [compost metagenome]